MRLTLGLYSELVLTRGAWERGYPRDYTPYWCSPEEPGNEASPGRVLCTGAHQGSQGMRLAMSLHSLLVLTRTGLAMSLHTILVLIKGVWEQG